ncbi:MAG: hypothetical protein JNL11_09100 [Bdellovibrionaceae bacterium]|nr:hypothetical protein [Pseudobdellovibrionaceae bacterium]
MKINFFLILILSSILISCSSSQSGSPFGDFKSTQCQGDNCTNQTVNPEPSIERDDNSDVVLGKFDNTLELSGKCRLKKFADNEIQIQVAPEGGNLRTLTDGYVPIIGVTSTGSRSAKCEKGRWAIAVSACNNNLGFAGVHRVDLIIKGKENNRLVEIDDGRITMNLIRSLDCDFSVQ